MKKIPCATEYFLKSTSISILVGTSLLAEMLKACAYNAGDPGRSLGQEDPLEKEMATRFSILAWKIPQTEQPSGLQSMGSQRVGYNLVIKQPQSIKLHRPFIKVTLEIHIQYLTVSIVSVL